MGRSTSWTLFVGDIGWGVYLVKMYTVQWNNARIVNLLHSSRISWGLIILRFPDPHYVVSRGTWLCIAWRTGLCILLNLMIEPSGTIPRWPHLARAVVSRPSRADNRWAPVIIQSQTSASRSKPLWCSTILADEGFVFLLISDQMSIEQLQSTVKSSVWDGSWILDDCQFKDHRQNALFPP